MDSIRVLKAKQQRGETLNADQIRKVQNEQNLLKQIAILSLETGGQ